MDPLDDFLQDANQTFSKRQRNELTQLSDWRKSDYNPEQLRPLLKAYEPVINKRMAQWKAPAVPEDAFRAELQQHFVTALKTYDPTKGAALPTHIENHLRKAQRYNMKYQNVGYIPEAKASKIGAIDRTKNALTESLGRAPTYDEIAEELQMNPKHVQKIEAARVKAIKDSVFAEGDDPTEFQASQDKEILALLPYRLTEKERLVFNHLYGLEGAPQIQSGNQLAKRLGMSPSDISRIRSSIYKKFQEAKTG